MTLKWTSLPTCLCSMLSPYLTGCNRLTSTSAPGLRQFSHRQPWWNQTYKSVHLNGFHLAHGVTTNHYRCFSLCLLWPLFLTSQLLPARMCEREIQGRDTRKHQSKLLVLHLSDLENPPWWRRGTISGSQEERGCEKAWVSIMKSPLYVSHWTSDPKPGRLMCRTCCPPKHVQVQIAPRYSFCHWFPTW